MLNSVRTQLYDKYGTEVDSALHQIEEPLYEAYDNSDECLRYSNKLAFQRQVNILGIYLEGAIDEFVGIRRDSLGNIIDA